MKEEKEESNFISLLSDYGFKIVFANESDTTFLKRALEALIQADIPIRKVTFLQNEFVGLTDEARGGVYDLVCEDEKERIFIVEMQLGHYKYFIQRAKFYAFQKFNTMVEKGKYRFDNLTPIYCIGFLVKPIFHESEEYYHFGRLKNQKGEEMDGQISHIIVEIAKFGKEQEEIITDLDKLIYLMKNLETIKGADQLPKFLTEDWIDQAMKKLDKSQMTAEQRMNYEMMMARNASIIQMQNDEKKKAAEEAIIEAAIKLKESGVDIKIIAQSTGLTEKQVEEL